MTLRSGFAFIPSFLTANQDDDFNYLDSHKIIGSLGIGYLFSRNSLMKVPVQIDLGFQAQLWLSKDVSKSVADNLNPHYSYGGLVLIGALTTSMKF